MESLAILTGERRSVKGQSRTERPQRERLHADRVFRRSAGSPRRPFAFSSWRRPRSITPGRRPGAAGAPEEAGSACWIRLIQPVFDPESWYSLEVAPVSGEEKGIVDQRSRRDFKQDHPADSRRWASARSASQIACPSASTCLMNSLSPNMPTTRRQSLWRVAFRRRVIARSSASTR